MTCVNGQQTGFQTLSSLLTWTPTDARLVSRVALAPTVYTGPKILICHDMQGGYLETEVTLTTLSRHVSASPLVVWTGTGAWMAATHFCYFSHQFVSPPPVAYVELAHKHGVKALGTMITEWEGGAEMCKLLLVEDTMDKVVEKMVGLCAFVGFDGYLVNIENPCDPQKMLIFVVRLRRALQAVNPNWEVVWYDAVTDQGQLRWQNALTRANRMFFDCCDGMFVNYQWNHAALAHSMELAESRGRDVFMGIDVHGRSTFLGGGLGGTAQAAKVAIQGGASVAIFAPAWTHENFSAHQAPTVSTLFWDSLRDALLECGVEPRRHASLPLETNFFNGVAHGHKGAVDICDLRKATLDCATSLDRMVLDKSDGGLFSVRLDPCNVWDDAFVSLSLFGQLGTDHVVTLAVWDTSLTVDSLNVSVVSKGDAADVDLGCRRLRSTEATCSDLGHGWVERVWAVRGITYIPFVRLILVGQGRVFHSNIARIRVAPHA